MKKPLLIVLLLAGFVWLPASGQEFSLEVHGAVRIAALGETVEIFAKITNLTDTELPYSITREEDIPETWTSSICIEQCLAPFIDSTGSVLPPGGVDSISVWIISNTVEGSGNVTFRVFSGSGGQKSEEYITFTAITQAVELLVVDSGREDDYEDYVSSLLPGEKLAATWNAWAAVPSAAQLDHFTEVYWLAGDRSDALGAEARTAIGSYLDGGGKLLLSGQNIARGLCDPLSPDYSAEECTFLGEYLHAAYTTDNAGVTRLSGVAGDGLGNGLDFAITGGTGANNQSSPDGVTAADGGAHTFLDYEGTAHAGGIRFASGDTRLVYLPFGLEGIADEAARQAIVDRAAAFFHDETAPELALGVFQNPYLTSYVDLYLLGSEALEGSALQMTVDGGPALTLSLVDGYENVWRADYKLQSTGEVTVAASATDMAGHAANLSSGFGATKIDASRGGVVTSADGALELEVKPGTLQRDEFIVVVAEEKRPANRKERAARPAMIALSPDKSANASRYTISPGKILRGKPARLSFRWDEARFNQDELDKLTIRREGDAVPLETWIDMDRRIAQASVTDLGGFSFGPDGEGRVSRIDHAFASLAQNEPNPFNPVTTIRFEIRADQRVRLEVYDVAGRLVKSLVNDQLPPGDHMAVWRGMTEDGRPATSGVYFARLLAGKNQQTKKITLIR